MAWRPKPGAIRTPALGGQPDDHWPAADRPIMSADQDMLGRGRFAKRVAEVINGAGQREESSVLAIVGPWGSGKSSVINLACEELEALNSPWKICAANPWAPPDVPSLIAELFAAIRSGVPKGKRGRKATQLIAEWGALVSADLLLVTGREKAMAMAAGVAAGVAARVAQHGVQRPMQDVFQELSAELGSLNLQVLVILDDVDRLQPDELLMLFKAIRLIASFPGVYYLLAYDEHTVLDILIDTPIARNSRDRALAYLEKIVQVPLAMPPTEYFYGRKLLTEGLTTLLGRRGAPLTDEQKYRFDVLYDSLLHHTLAEPRAVGRFLGQLTAYLPLIDPAELDLVDLLTLVHLRSFAPATHRLLSRSKALLTSTELLPAGAPLREALDARVNSECGDFCTEVLGVLTEVFPVLRDTSGDADKSIRAKLDIQLREESRRVSVAEYFERYFLLGLPVTDISDSVAREALRAIARDERNDARTRVEEKLADEDPAAASIVVRKLTRLTRAGDVIEVAVVGPVIRYAVSIAELRPDDALDEYFEAWAVAALTRIARDRPDPIPAFISGLSDDAVRRLSSAVDRADRGDDQVRSAYSLMREVIAREAGSRILDHLRRRDEADLAFPFVPLARAASQGTRHKGVVSRLIAGLDSSEYTLADLAARFVEVGTYPDGRQKLLGLSADPLITLLGLIELGDRCAILSSATDIGSFDEHDVTWEGRGRAGIPLLNAELQKRRAVAPTPPSGVLKQPGQSALWDRGPRRWGNRPELTTSSPAEPRPLLCVRAAVLLPGLSQGFPGVSPPTEISDEQRAKVIQEALQKSLLTDWFRAMTRKFGVEAEPRWEENGYTTSSFAGFVLSRADPPESSGPLPLQAHCAVTSGAAVPGGPDGLAVALDLLIDMPFPSEEAAQGGVESSAIPTGLGPSLSPWPTPELKSLSGLVQMMTNSVVPTARIVASRLLNLNATDGNVGLWLATTTSFGEILDLDQFSAVPGSGSHNEVSVFASLPLEPGQHFDTDPYFGSVRGLAVHLIDQLLQQEHRRGYVETLHALRTPTISL
jgi:predicted KAP-like P-loop ATPase